MPNLREGTLHETLSSNHDVILAYRKSDSAIWNDAAAFIPYDPENLPPKTAAKYCHRDPDGRRYELKDLTNPNPDRPNLTYEFLGVTRVWRWRKDRMQRAYEDGLIVQTAPGRVPRYKRYLDEQRGTPLGDVWTDISPINSRAAERLGYPTQKPMALLERIIASGSNPGDIVLDPFCGCGTAIDAAQKLERRWMGIDITYLAIDLIEKRLRGVYGNSVMNTFTVNGIPRDVEAAQALWNRSPFEFERWAVSQIDAQPNERQVGDRGFDGVIRFPIDGRGGTERILVSVKGGKRLGPHMVRDLMGAVHNQRAAGGVLITLERPTQGMLNAVNHSGLFEVERQGRSYPRLQLITVPELLHGKRPKLPPVLLPYVQAQRRPSKPDQLMLDT